MVDSAPEPDAHVEDRARARYESARREKQVGRLQVAVDLLLESLALSEHYKSQELLGECFRDLGDDAAALVQFRRAFECNPRSTKTGVLYAECLLRSGASRSQCQDVIDRVLEVNPSYGPARRIQQELESRDV